MDFKDPKSKLQNPLRDILNAILPFLKSIQLLLERRAIIIPISSPIIKI